MAKCESYEIFNPLRFYDYGTDNVVCVSQGLNFVHKRKENGGACSKLGGGMCK